MSEAQTDLFSPPDAAALTVPDLSRLVTARAFHDLVAKGETEGVIVAKDFHDVEVAKDGDQFRFTLTSGAVDRDSDVIEQAGLEWAELEKNPIWLWSHDSRGTGLYPAQIGIITERKTLKSRTDVRVKYVPKEVNPLGEAVRQLHEFRAETGALGDRGGAVSIGMMPLEFSFDKTIGGVRFKRGEPLEGSDVAIGSNRDALMRAKAAGVELDALAEWAEAVRKIVSPDQGRAESIVRALDPVPPGNAVLVRLPDSLEKAAPSRAEAAMAVVAEAAEKLTGLVERLEAATAKAEVAKERRHEPAEVPELVENYEEFKAALRDRAEREYIARTGQPFQETTEEPT